MAISLITGVQGVYNRPCDLRPHKFSKWAAVASATEQTFLPANAQIDPLFIGGALALTRPAGRLDEAPSHVASFQILSSRPQEGIVMLNQTRSIVILKIFVVISFLAAWGWSQQPQDRRQPQGAPRRDAVVDAQTTQNVPITRPEQRKTEHDLSDIFKDTKAESSSPALNNQQEQC